MTILDQLEALLAEREIRMPDGEPIATIERWGDEVDDEDAALIVAAVNALPDLLAAVRALRDEVEMEDQSRKWIEQAVVAIQHDDPAEAFELLDTALQDLAVSDETRSILARLGAKGEGEA